MKRWSTIKWLLHFVRSYRFQLGMAALLGSISNLAVIGIPLLAVRGWIQLTQGAPARIGISLLGMILCGCLRAGARYFEQYLNHDIAFRLLAHIRQEIFAKLRMLGPAKLVDFQSGDLLTSLTHDVEAIEVFFAHTVSPILIASLTSAVLIVGVALMSPIVACFLFFCFLLIGVWQPIRSYRQYHQVGARWQAANVELNQTLLEVIAGRKELYEYHQERATYQQLRLVGEKMNQESAKKVEQEQALTIQADTLIYGGAICLLGYLTVAFQGNPNSLFLLVFFLSSFGTVLALHHLGNALVSTFASAERLYQLLQTKPNVAFVRESSLGATGSVAVNSLDFAYSEREKLLRNVQVKLAEGDFMGIQGASGSGKSTLLQILQRYWDPQRGEIFLGDAPLANYSLENLTKTEGVMEQATFLVKGTLAENILIARPTATKEEVRKAAHLAALGQWIEQLPEGYATSIGPNSRQLSEGERQRVGLARLFLHDAPLLLLDEPTSNLDYLNEQLIMQTLGKAEPKRTILLVSHRSTTLAHAKQHYQLVAGTIKKNSGS